MSPPAGLPCAKAADLAEAADADGATGDAAAAGWALAKCQAEGAWQGQPVHGRYHRLTTGDSGMASADTPLRAAKPTCR